MRMPAKLKTKWLKALRSGTYKQARGILYNPNTTGFCCLGVLQHVADKGCVEVNNLGNYMNIPTREWCENKGIAVDTEWWTVESDPQIDQLTCMNDDKKYGFKRIANWIEKNVEAY